MSDEEQRERTAVYDGWRQVRTLEDVDEMEMMVDRFEAGISSDPKGVLAADVAIAREMLKDAAPVHRAPR